MAATQSGEQDLRTGQAGASAARQAAGADSSRDAIILAAAHCFMKAGYGATSIDDVAHELNATKGRVYHYYRSKAELFYDVHRRGMAINFSVIEPIMQRDLAPREKLEAMSRAHVHAMLEHLDFQRVVMQGVEMHLAGA
ncbi:MAG: helix-turn-helix domain-containing protein, partial [Pseudomonadota bacterium]|nr:helix-turn-helix domain-containing protein [Pseudomonadota bacterium]